MTDCRHIAIKVNRAEREVRCASCGAVLDPIAQLADLERLTADFERRLQALDAREADQRRRQAFAIEQKQKTQRRRQLREARANCELCGGSGWAPGRGGVVPCACRRPHAVVNS